MKFLFSSDKAQTMRTRHGAACPEGFLYGQEETKDVSGMWVNSQHQAYGFKNLGLPLVRDTRQKPALWRRGRDITHGSFHSLHLRGLV